jgi:SAM-dependent methyltransferase
MKPSAFDAYEGDYAQTVERSIAFSGREHAFFLRAKVQILTSVLARQVVDMGTLAVLDAGCGIGAIHPTLVTQVKTLDGCDLSGPCLERARVNNPGVIYTRSTGVNLPYESASFDMVTTTCVLHHVLPHEWKQYVSELVRVVRPGGLVVIIEHNPYNPLTRLAVRRCAFDHDAILLTHFVTQRLLRAVGLARVASEFFLLLPTEGRFGKSIEHRLRKFPFGAQYITYGPVPG